MQALLTFAAVDNDAFPLLSLAERAVADGGAMGAVINAADEIAVGAFLDNRLGFLGISDTVCAVYEKMSSAKGLTSLEDILAADEEARNIARSIIKEI